MKRIIGMLILMLMAFTPVKAQDFQCSVYVYAILSNK